MCQKNIDNFIAALRQVSHASLTVLNLHKNLNEGEKNFFTIRVIFNQPHQRNSSMEKRGKIAQTNKKSRQIK